MKTKKPLLILLMLLIICGIMTAGETESESPHPFQFSKDKIAIYFVIFALFSAYICVLAFKLTEFLYQKPTRTKTSFNEKRLPFIVFTSFILLLLLYVLIYLFKLYKWFYLFPLLILFTLLSALLNAFLVLPSELKLPRRLLLSLPTGVVMSLVTIIVLIIL